MSFPTEPTQYNKTIFSDLQGAWGVFRQSVVDAWGFPGCDKVIFHIDEAMSWETVRNLTLMSPLILIIRNLCLQGEVPEEVMENLEDVSEIYDEVVLEHLGG